MQTPRHQDTNKIPKKGLLTPLPAINHLSILIPNPIPTSTRSPPIHQQPSHIHPPRTSPMFPQGNHIPLTVHIPIHIHIPQPTPRALTPTSTHPALPVFMPIIPFVVLISRPMSMLIPRPMPR